MISNFIRAFSLQRCPSRTSTKLARFASHGNLEQTGRRILHILRLFISNICEAGWLQKQKQSLLLHCKATVDRTQEAAKGRGGEPRASVMVYSV